MFATRSLTLFLSRSLSKPMLVFVHAGWRTGSTYVWSRVRRDERAIAYCEPFHEGLASLTPATLAEGWPDRWPSSHPELDAPYFDEFTPLLNGIGVVGYDERFSADLHFMKEEDEARDLEEYITRLWKHAQDQGKSAVLCCCRTLARVGWLRRKFPSSIHIVQMRHPYHHWRSSHAQWSRHGNPYFLLMPILNIGQSPAWHPLGMIAERYGVWRCRATSFGECYAHYLKIFETLTEEQRASMFAEYYAAAYDHALRYADFVLDIDEVTTNLRARKRAERAFQRLTGIGVSFADADVNTYPVDNDDPILSLNSEHFATRPLERRYAALWSATSRA